MFKKTGGGFVFLAILVGLCGWAATGVGDNMELGIDLRGGTELLYRVTPFAESSMDPSDAAEQAKLILGLRLDAFGLKELSLAIVGRDQLLVEVPGAGTGVENIKGVIERGGRMDFHLVSNSQSDAEISRVERQQEQWQEKLTRWRQSNEGKKPADWTPVPTGAPTKIVATEFAKDEKTNQWVRDPETGEREILRKYVLENDPGSPDAPVSGKWIRTARSAFDENGLPAVAFEFTQTGAVKFGELTREDNHQKSLAIVLDGQIMQVATIQSTITVSGQLTGNYDADEIKEIVTVLKAGSLPADLKLQNEQTIGSTLGAESIANGAKAMLMGLGLIIVFMAIYYLSLGIVADLALLTNMLLIVSALLVFRNTLTFPGLAGLLLTIGMSVDANILIFERIREERSKGKSLNQAVTGGYGRAFSTILDANLTTLITAFILYKFGTGPVKGFAIVLSIGIITSFFTSLWVSRLLLSILMKFNLIKQLHMMQIVKDTAIDFLSARKLATVFSVVAIGFGLVALLGRGGEALGIDFTGGTRLQMNLVSQKATSDVRAQLEKDTVLRDAGFTLQPLGGSGDEASQFSMRCRGLAVEENVPQGAEPTSESIRARVEKALGSDLAPAGFDVTSSGPSEVAATVRIRKSDEANRTSFEAYVQSLRDWGAAKVSENQNDPSAGSEFLSFDVRRAVGDAENAQSLLAGLETGVKNEDAAGRGLEIQQPFSTVIDIGPKVASDLQGKVFIAMVISFLAIIFYITLRFRFQFGLAAIVALVHDILFTLGFLAIGDLLLGDFLNLKINLPVVAALLTTIGYSLNDTIVIFDRIRENLEGKKRDVDLTKIVNHSINQTLGRTVLTSATTFIVVGILLVLGGAPLQGFAFALCIGVLVGTYSSMYVASPALIHFNNKALKRREEALKELANA